MGRFGSNLTRFSFLIFIASFIIIVSMNFSPQAQEIDDCQLQFTEPVTILEIDPNRLASYVDLEDIDASSIGLVIGTNEEIVVSPTDLLSDSISITSRGRLKDLSHWVVEYRVNNNRIEGFISVEDLPMETYRQQNSGCAIRTFGLPEYSDENSLEYTLEELSNDYFNFDHEEWVSLTGENINVGVIDNCFDEIDPTINATFVATPSLPELSSCTNISYTASDHGSHVIEVIAGLAPDVNLFYSQFLITNTGETLTQFSEAATALADMDIIVYAGNILALEQDYPVYEEIVETLVTEQDILWINSAGNLGSGYIPTSHDSDNEPVQFNSIHTHGNRSNTRTPYVQAPVDENATVSVNILWEVREDLVERGTDLSGTNVEYVYGYRAIIHDSNITIPPEPSAETPIFFTNRLDLEEYIPPPRTAIIPNNIGNDWFATDNIISIRVVPVAQSPRVLEAARPVLQTNLEMIVTGVIPTEYTPYLNYVDSYPSIVLPPAYSSFVWTVGAYDENLDDLTWYTSHSNERQYASSRQIKPDIAVPGLVQIEGSTFSGTSAAAPIVAAVAARVLQYQRTGDDTYSPQAVRDLLMMHESCLLNSNVQGRLVGYLALPLPSQLGMNVIETPCHQQDATLERFPRNTLPIRGGRLLLGSEATPLGNNRYEVSDSRLTINGEFFADNNDFGDLTFVLEMFIDGRWGVMPGFPEVDQASDQLSYTEDYNTSNLCELGAQDTDNGLRQRRNQIRLLNLGSRENYSIRTGELYVLKFDEHSNLDEDRPRFNRNGEYRIRMRVCDEDQQIGQVEEVVILLRRPDAIEANLSVASQDTTNAGLPIVTDDNLTIFTTVRGETLVGYTIEQVLPDGTRTIFPGLLTDSNGTPIIPNLSDYPQDSEETCQYVMTSEDPQLFIEADDTFNDTFIIPLRDDVLKDELLNGEYTLQLVLCTASEDGQSFVSVQPDDPDSILSVPFVIERLPQITINDPATNEFTIPANVPNEEFFGTTSAGGFQYQGYFIEVTVRPEDSDDTARYLMTPSGSAAEAMALEDETDDDLCALVADSDAEEVNGTLFNLITNEIQNLDFIPLPLDVTIRFKMCIETSDSTVDETLLEATYEVFLGSADLTVNPEEFDLINVGGTRIDVIGTIVGADRYIIGLSPVANPTNMRVIYGPGELVNNSVLLLEDQFVTEDIDEEGVVDEEVAETGTSTTETSTVVDENVIEYKDVCTYEFTNAEIGTPGSLPVENATLASIFLNQYPEGIYRIVIIVCLDGNPDINSPIFIPNLELDENSLVSGGALSLFEDEFSAVVLTPEANLYSGPGTQFRVVGTVQETQALALKGRTQNNAWLQISLPDETEAWIRSQDVFITLDGFDLDDLLVTDQDFRTSDVYYASDISGRWQIYRTSESDPLTELGNNEFPSFNGMRVVFSSDRNGDTDIFIMNADGSEEDILISTAGSDERPVWSNDGQSVLFESDASGVRQLYVYSLDTRAFITVTDTIGAPCCVSWSRDDSQIVYSSNATGAYNIYVANADGTGDTQITDGAFGVDNLYPSWSPNDNRLVYQSDRTGTWQIYTARSDGTATTQLTFTTEGSVQPTWASADEIIYSTYINGRLDLYIMNADGSNQRPLVSESGSEAGGEPGQ